MYACEQRSKFAGLCAYTRARFLFFSTLNAHRARCQMRIRLCMLAGDDVRAMIDSNRIIWHLNRLAHGSKAIEICLRRR